MPALYLIDGNSYFYRAFYAIKGLTNSKGFPTNAIYGFTNMLLKIIKEKSPDYIGVVFDTPAPTARHKAYQEYKAHRPKMPYELSEQIPHIKEMVRAFNLPVLEMEGYEADDIIATLAKRAEKEGMDVFIVTADKDICQVLSERIRAYDTMKEKITEEKDVIERFGVEPERLPEIMALTGDKSDNIPGVQGIGEKTAKDLIKQFGSLDNLIKNYSQIKSAGIKDAVSKNIDNINLSLMLATIDINVPVDISISEFKAKEPDWPALLRLFKEFEFGSLIKLAPAKRSLESEYITVVKEEDMDKAINSIKGELALDTETTSKYPMQAGLVGISFSAEPEKAYYIPLAHSYAGVPEQLSKKYVIRGIREILESEDIKKTGHNIKYDLLVLRGEEIELRGIAFDTMIASYLLNPSVRNPDLRDIVSKYLGFDFETRSEKEMNLLCNTDEKIIYYCKLADFSHQIAKAIEGLLKKESL
ncbi:MAG: DNA polymerase I, partial [Nitrospirae bacterium]|nr:DNA polymerase I [Nitrospirota bacterium]